MSVSLHDLDLKRLVAALASSGVDTQSVMRNLNGSKMDRTYHIGLYHQGLSYSISALALQMETRLRTFSIHGHDIAKSLGFA